MTLSPGTSPWCIGLTKTARQNGQLSGGVRRRVRKQSLTNPVTCNHTLSLPKHLCMWFSIMSLLRGNPQLLHKNKDSELWPSPSSFAWVNVSSAFCVTDLGFTTNWWEHLQGATLAIRSEAFGRQPCNKHSQSQLSIPVRAGHRILLSLTVDLLQRPSAQTSAIHSAHFGGVFSLVNILYRMNLKPNLAFSAY